LASRTAAASSTGWPKAPNWDSAEAARAAIAKADGGCLINWDASTDIAALSKDQEALGCIVNWMGVDPAALQAAAESADVCIINW